MTLKELYKQVSIPKKNTRVPSRKNLVKNEIPIAVSKTIDSAVTVFSNGFVLYETNNRNTVFPLPDKNKSYRYLCFDDIKGENVSVDIDADYFANSDFAVLLTLIGEDRINENNLSGYNRRIEIDIETYEMFIDNFEGSRDCEDIFLSKENSREMLQKLSKKQRTAVVMHAIHGFTFDEIGKRIGTSRQYAQQLYKQGVNQLQQSYA